MLLEKLLKKQYSSQFINQEFTVYGRKVANRVLIHPMEGSDGKANGGIGELTKRRYRRFAQSGVGIIWFEAIAVSPQARASARQLCLSAENVEEFRLLLNEIKSISKEKFGFSPIIIAQLTHSGRYSKPDDSPKPIVARKSQLFDKQDLIYNYVSEKECKDIVDDFVKTAKLATLAGFDGIDVKCCHGYLFNEFMSAYNRKDCYGGSLENRSRLFFECIDAVRGAIDENIFITTRLNAYDGFAFPEGFGVSDDGSLTPDLTEAKIIINKLFDKGIRLINITNGNPYVNPHVNRPQAQSIEDGKIGVNRMLEITKDLQQTFPQINFVCSALTYLKENAMNVANGCLAEGVAKVVGFGRMSFAYPQFYQDYLKNGKIDDKKCCVACGKCSFIMRNGGYAGCPIRDSEEYLPKYLKAVEKTK